MKRRLLTLALIIPALAILSYLAGDKVILAARIAQLYGAAPDEQLAMPVAGVSKDKVNDSWHAPRDGGDRQHQGQDIFAPKGTAVLSATDGYVVRVGENKLGGKTVSVVGAGGRMYYYAHLDGYAPNIGFGDYVTPLTVLGFVGTTGNAAGTSPHLHFGVYARGGPINPLPLLADRPEQKSPQNHSPKKKGRR
jgi:murein DD-endopeptidase MepM/ murein hydrolase activator NlpD